jgi:hypothetical protein
VEVDPPIAGPQEAGLWLERFLRRAPQQLGLGLLRQLLAEPAGATAEEQISRGKVAADQPLAQDEVAELAGFGDR